MTEAVVLHRIADLLLINALLLGGNLLVGIANIVIGWLTYRWHYPRGQRAQTPAEALRNMDPGETMQALRNNLLSSDECGNGG